MKHRLTVAVVAMFFCLSPSALTADKTQPERHPPRWNFDVKDETRLKRQSLRWHFDGKAVYDLTYSNGNSCRITITDQRGTAVTGLDLFAWRNNGRLIQTIKIIRVNDSPVVVSTGWTHIESSGEWRVYINPKNNKPDDIFRSLCLASAKRQLPRNVSKMLDAYGK